MAEQQSDDPFDEHLADWIAYTQTPWARIRYAVVAETLSRHLPALGPALRVLDVGGGDGLDSLPLAAAGHDVTLVDTSEAMLAHARQLAAEAGVTDRVHPVHASIDDLSRADTGYDVVLCHFVLHYRPPGTDVGRLAATVRPGGLLSVIAPNPPGRVLQALTRNGPAAALEQLGSTDWESVTFAHEGRQLPYIDVVAELEAAGLEVVARYGGRIANDLVTCDEKKSDPDFYADLERLEIALCDRDPFRDIGVFWQLIARKPG